jgi:hypothetical protein
MLRRRLPEKHAIFMQLWHVERAQETTHSHGYALAVRV